MWSWRRKISQADGVNKCEVCIHTIKENRNTQRIIRRRKATRTCHVLRRNCILNILSMESGKEVTGGWGRRCTQLLIIIMEARGYCKYIYYQSSFAQYKQICRISCYRLTLGQLTAHCAGSVSAAQNNVNCTQQHQAEFSPSFLFPLFSGSCFLD